MLIFYHWGHIHITSSYIIIIGFPCVGLPLFSYIIFNTVDYTCSLEIVMSFYLFWSKIVYSELNEANKYKKIMQWLPQILEEEV